MGEQAALAVDDVRDALGSVRSVLQADGADIELLGVDGATARLELLLVGANCAECVLPRPLLEEVALQMLRAQLPDLAAVEIVDPRETG